MEDIIRGTLPHLDSKTIVKDLPSLGVREINKFMYIKEDDIRHLSIVDCRKLLQRFNNIGKYLVNVNNVNK